MPPKLKERFAARVMFGIDRPIGVANAAIGAMLKDPNFIVQIDGTVLTRISRQGHLTDTWRVKPQCIDKCGYARVRYFHSNIFVHRLVFAKFHGSLMPDMQVNHIDGNPGNNHAENLEQLYPNENMIHSYQKLKRVVNYGNAKISESEAIEMRNLYARGATYADLMKRFNVSKTTVSYVINMKIWGEK
jgi:hypothetical protein